MYHPPSKRKQLIQRIATYAFMSTAVVVLVTVLVFVMLGYRFLGDGKIEQGGLVQLDSQPNGADAMIDGTIFGSRTPSKTTLLPGQHTISIGRSGYQAWQKTVDVVPGAVLWLDYARLIPSKLTPQSVATLPGLASTSVSPDEKWVALKDKPDTSTIQFMDISGDTVKANTITLPVSTYTQPDPGKSQAFTLESWDSGNRYLIVKHTYNDDQVEWLVVDSRDTSATKDVSRLLDIQASKLVFSGNDSNTLYAQIGTDVRKIDLGAATLSRPLVTQVAEFSIFDQTTIVYSTVYNPDVKTRSVGYYKDGDTQPHVVRTYSDDGQAPLHLAIGRYFGDMYEAVAYGDKVTVFTGDLPVSNAPNPSLKTVATVTMPGGAQYLSIKTEGRFVVMQNQGTYDTYDLELKKNTTTTLAGTAPVTSEIGWIDGYMPWSDRDGELRLYEFDGANQHDIMSVVPGSSVTLSPNARYLYGIQKSNDGIYHLERVRLILP
jgi:hypothetical protein